MSRLLIVALIPVVVGCGQSRIPPSQWDVYRLAEHLNEKGVKVVAKPHVLKPDYQLIWLETEGTSGPSVMVWHYPDGARVAEALPRLREAFVYERFAIGVPIDSRSKADYELLDRIRKVLKPAVEVDPRSAPAWPPQREQEQKR
jgi:hypothetical protein